MAHPQHLPVRTIAGHSRALAVAVSTVATSLLAISLTGSAHAADPWVTQVAASYRIQLAGVKFGNYAFRSVRTGQTYRVSSDAKLRAFFGAFKWRGSANSSGTMTARGPQPSSYVYNFRKNKKRPKSVSVAMAGGNATQVVHTPPRNRSKRRIPITRAHYTGVVDPMSALIALSAPANGANPCNQSVRVFDGLHRFDVKLSPKGVRRIDLRQGRGFARKARVCRVEYFPIAGHKRGKSNNYITDPKGMEVWLVPAANGLLYVPYRITVPTIIGNAVLQATAVKVDLSNNRQLAMNY